jgi:hypothetical protein
MSQFANKMISVSNLAGNELSTFMGNFYDDTIDRILRKYVPLQSKVDTHEFDDGVVKIKMLEGINDFAFHFRFYQSSNVTEDIVNQIAEDLKPLSRKGFSVLFDLDSSESKQAYNDFLKDIAKEHSEAGKGIMCKRLFFPATGGVICKEEHIVYSDGPCRNENGKAYLVCIDYRCTEGDLNDFQTKREAETRVAGWRSKGLCTDCGGTLKGFFGKKCAMCGKIQ